MLKLNTRYVRRSPTGEEVPAIARNEAEQNYHDQLEQEGYTYTEVVEVKPRGNICLSCEA